MKKEKEVDYGTIGGAFVVLLLLSGVGYFVGGLFGAFVGAGFAYMAWWLKDIDDMLLKDRSDK